MSEIELQWNGFFWEASISDVAWSGFQERKGPYGAISSNKPSLGDVTVVFAPEGRGDDPLNAEELSLVSWFLAHQQEVADAVVDLLFNSYWEIKAGYIEEFGEEISEAFPDIKSKSDVKQLVGIVSVNIHQVSKDDIPYIGVEMGCNWEEEHGLGFLLHGREVVDLGGADTAILLWKARQHANKT
ncbi:DUF6985 domain-containing protein [Microbulbifer sediminum]|uniref:DUF6985 domain-containing protein n=1 Tax=Microbulbifer sediminum TaxID=2904250 RepID=UPI001F38359A|nr:hypothetical protein [Microbulbifer sediminum]